MADASELVATSDIDAKIWDIENKILDHIKYITTPEFNTLAAKFW